MSEWEDLLACIQTGHGKWSQKSYHFEIGSCELLVEQDRFYKDEPTYEIFVSIKSPSFGAFLECCRHIPQELPKIRQSKASAQHSGVLGQALLNIVVPGQIPHPDDGIVVVPGPYERSSPLNPVGYSSNTASQVAEFLSYVKECLHTPLGVYVAHQEDGFITTDLGQFDAFYSYVWSAVNAGVSQAECSEGLMKALSDVDRRKIPASDVSAFLKLIYEGCGGRKPLLSS